MVLALVVVPLLLLPRRGCLVGEVMDVERLGGPGAGSSSGGGSSMRDGAGLLIPGRAVTLFSGRS